GAIMLSTALIALDSTVVATAVPSVVRDIGGFSQFPWLFSAYLLTQAVTVPIYGKLSDVVGRKPMITFGVIVFILGSLLCGVAWSMPTLIAARAVQGIGAGAILPMGMTIIADLYSVEERARVQGYIASVWATASVVGPLTGGLFSEYVSWRWIFFINLPLGAIALVALRRRFVESVVHREHRIDYAGAGLLTTGCTLLILGLLEGGTAWSWRSSTSMAVLGVAVVCLFAFVRVEQRAAEPILPLWIFRRRTLVSGNLVAIGVGALIIGTSSYVPAYLQGVLGSGAVEAGLVLGALTMGWPIAAGLSGRVYMRIGFRDTALIGMVFGVSGSVLTATLPEHSSPWYVACTLFLTGLGLGLCSSPLMVAIQSVVGWDRRGVVTGTNMFCRSMGSALGAAVFGAIANATLVSRFADPPAGIVGPLPHDIDGTTRALAQPGPVARFAQDALYAAAHNVFLALAVTAVLIAAAVALLPRRTSPLVFDD
ncbi:MAG: major facilitator superfamily 1, partial [Frankiales bacterium]|nr:major facilitator superfamily 1 [Frankiales bacterium]